MVLQSNGVTEKRQRTTDLETGLEAGETGGTIGGQAPRCGPCAGGEIFLCVRVRVCVRRV